MKNMDGVVTVRDYGAKGDGVSLDTAAVQAAVDAASATGGRVVLSPGVYMCGTIVLKSRVTLDLLPGARILGSPQLEDYLTGEWGHNKDITPWHLIVAEGAENVTITGEGEIDGNGPAFWQQDRPHEWHFWREHVRRVSPMIQFDDCRHVRIENVTLRNTPGWTVHLRRCEHVAVRGVTMRNGLFGPNNDGLDINGCRYVTVSDCDIETGDDAIVLKTTHDAGPTEYVTVTNCVLRTSCVAFKLGSESWHPFRHIVLSNCVVPSCSRAVTLLTYDGGDIEHVRVCGLAGTTNSGWPVNRPIEVYSECRENLATGHEETLRPPDRPTVPGRIRAVTLRDIDLVTDGRVMLVARKDRPIEDLSIEGLRLTYVLLEDPAAVGANGWVTSAHTAVGSAAAAIVAENVRGLRLLNPQIRWPAYPVAEGWHVLRAPNRIYNRHFYEGREEAIRSGACRVPFWVLWARGVQGEISLGDLIGSEGGPPCDAQTHDHIGKKGTT
jgi:hypothetical protein